MNKYLNANAVFSKFSRDYMELKKDLPIRPSEMGVLNIITRREGRYTPVMLSDLLGVSKPMIATHISSLEEKGYIYKDMSSNDKRSFCVLPTEKALTLVSEAEDKLNEHLMAIESKLGEENFDLLIDLLSQAEAVLKDKGDF